MPMTKTMQSIFIVILELDLKWVVVWWRLISSQIKLWSSLTFTTKSDWLLMQTFSPGWPNETILSKGPVAVATIFLTIFLTYLIPITVSCGIYIALICNKKHTFQNKGWLTANIIVRTYSCKEVHPQHASLTRGINPSMKLIK